MMLTQLKSATVLNSSHYHCDWRKENGSIVIGCCCYCCFGLRHLNAYIMAHIKNAIIEPAHID